MTPVDTFLRSVRGAFQPGFGDSGWLWAAFGLAVLLAVLANRLWARRVRGRAGKAAFAQLLVERRLSAADGHLLAQLGQGVGVPPLRVATHLDVFERATARALAGQTPTSASDAARPAGDGAADDVFARVHRLRRALGFHVVPEHLPVVTTRQLVPGTKVEVGGFGGEVIEVNEAWFVVIAAPDTTFVTTTPGVTARVTFTRDARYVTRCSLLSAEPPHGARKLVFRHDERPERHQLRAAVRVNARGTVQLSRSPDAPTADDDGARVAHDGAQPEGLDHHAASAASGSLIDISLGGLAMQWPRSLPIGASLHVTVEWNTEVYRGLPVSVLRCDVRPGGSFVVRLEFRGMPVAEEARLAAAIARHSARPDEPSRA